MDIVLAKDNQGFFANYKYNDVYDYFIFLFCIFFFVFKFYLFIDIYIIINKFYYEINFNR